MIRLFHKFWVDLLKLYQPNYTFSTSSTIRSAVESPRNPGIVHFVLKVSGDVSIDVLRTKFTDNILGRRNADNIPVYPKFQAVLKRFLGFYVWDENQR